MNLIRLSVLVAFLCQSGEAEEWRSPEMNLQAAKSGFLQYPMLKPGVYVVPSPALRRAERVFHFGDSLSFFKVLTHKIYRDSKVLELHPGDLNNDGLQDMLVIATRNPRKAELKNNELPIARRIRYRRVLLFLQTEGGIYRFGTYSNTAVESWISDGHWSRDAYRTTRVSNGKISFESIYGSYFRTIVTETYGYYPPYQYWYLETVLKESYSCDPRDNPPGTIAVDSVLLTADDFGRVVF